MPIILYSVGTLVLAIGAAMIGYGIPINEFSFGNTLIVAGTTAFVGGLIIVAVGIAVAQLQKLTDALATRPAVRSSRPFDTFDPAVVAAAAGRPQAAPARVPFPPKPTKAEARAAEAAVAERKAETPVPVPAAPVAVAKPFPERADDFAPPTLANPDEPPAASAEDAFPSPLYPPFAPKSTPDDRDEPEAVDDHAPASDNRDAPEAPDDRDDRREHVADAPPARPSTYFDSMWPAEPKAPEAEPKFVDPKPAEEKPAEPKVSEFHWSNVRRAAPGSSTPKADTKPPSGEEIFDLPTEEPAEPAEEEAPRAVAILKSGVVDGMGYTLYVDGSIEAELPQGTLRFASINELRSHLEKTS